MAHIDKVYAEDRYGDHEEDCDFCEGNGVGETGFLKRLSGGARNSKSSLKSSGTSLDPDADSEDPYADLDITCEECGGSGVQLTDKGDALIRFIRRHLTLEADLKLRI